MMQSGYLKTLEELELFIKNAIKVQPTKLVKTLNLASLHYFASLYLSNHKTSCGHLARMMFCVSPKVS